LDVLVDKTEAVAVGIRDGGLIAHHSYLSLAVQTSSRGTIQKPAVDREPELRLGPKHLCGRGDGYLQSLGHEILHTELDAADRFAGGIEQRLDGPLPERGGPTEIDRLVKTRFRRGFERKAPRLEAIWSAKHKSEGSAGQRHPEPITQQRDDLDGFARPIDTAVGVDEGFR